MIYYIDTARFADLQKLTAEKNIYCCKIGCLLDSYGLRYNFAEYWVQYIHDKPVTAIAKFYGDVTVYATDETDFRELTAFLEMTGYASVLCEREIFTGSYSGIVIEKSTANQTGKTAEINPDLNEVYRLLQSCKSDSFAVPEYEDFLLDMSHKIRHGTAICAGIREGGKIVSAAMTLAQSANSAIIGGVATDEHYRHSGYGTRCVNTLCNCLNGRKVFIMRDKNENERFYQTIGFKNQGKFYIKRGKIL